MNKKDKVICGKCKSEVSIILEDDCGCDDPECCGGSSSKIEVECPKCGLLDF